MGLGVEQELLDGAGRCIVNRYAKCMAQLVTRLDDNLLADVDSLVVHGVVANRSEAVRLGLKTLVDLQHRRWTGEQIAEAYRRQPQTDPELAGLDESTRALIEEEPW
jgi:Arc/MetJ-type ribon-helix-helix transcriptional regulator